MSVYNDYMVKVTTYFVALAETYCNYLSQGVDNCIIRNKMNLLSMYIDTIPRVGNENCLTNEQLLAISNHINILCGYPSWGTISGINITNPPITILPAYAASTQEAWSTTIGTELTQINFDNPLGINGSSWAITYIATNSEGDSVFVKTITSRTANGFKVSAYEDNVHFEGTATLITV